MKNNLLKKELLKLKAKSKTINKINAPGITAYLPPNWLFKLPNRIIKEIIIKIKIN